MESHDIPDNNDTVEITKTQIFVVCKTVTVIFDDSVILVEFLWQMVEALSLSVGRGTNIKYLDIKQSKKLPEGYEQHYYIQVQYSQLSCNEVFYFKTEPIFNILLPLFKLS